MWQRQEAPWHVLLRWWPPGMHTWTCRAYVCKPPSVLVTLLFTVAGKMQPMRGEGCFGFQCEDGSAWRSGKHVVQSGSRRQGWKREAAYSHVQRAENIEKTGSETGL